MLCASTTGFTYSLSNFFNESRIREQRDKGNVLIETIFNEVSFEIINVSDHYLLNGKHILSYGAQNSFSSAKYLSSPYKILPFEKLSDIQKKTAK